MKLTGKVAIITGAGQGIGHACAKRLLEDGAQVMLTDIKPMDSDLAAEFGAELAQRARFHQADVSLKAEVEAMVAATQREFGRIDILVNNAGVTHAADFLDLAEEDFDRVLRINLKSMFLCGQAVAKAMLAQEDKGLGGSIINMSSVNSQLTIPNQVPYVVSKGGINQLTKVMSLNLAPHGIRVNGVAPGTILTELAKKAVLASEQARHTILSRTPMGRCGEPEEIASVVSFLASSDASYMTGETIFVDGGRLALNYTVAVKD